eukprot:1689117-Rhodomonas_salina.1
MRGLSLAAADPERHALPPPVSCPRRVPTRTPLDRARRRLPAPNRRRKQPRARVEAGLDRRDERDHRPEDRAMAAKMMETIASHWKRCENQLTEMLPRTRSRTTLSVARLTHACQWETLSRH